MRSISLKLSLAVVVLSGLGAAQEAKKQTLTARGLTMEAPATWKKGTPQSSMRALELKFGPAEGDKDAAELVLFAFPGGAGTVQMNVDRWQQQFLDAAGKPAEIKTEKIKGKDVEVTLVEAAGRYVAAIQPGRPERYDKPDYRLLGAIVTTPETGYFIKSVGPEKTMTEAREAFIEMAKSIQVGK
jgi:hypothetical protein